MATSRTQIIEELRRLGVESGGLIMIHASLRKLRPEGGAEGLLMALRDVIGPDGTMMMPLGAEQDEPFDPLTTPAEEEIGALAEFFRTYRGVQVSDHVAGRMGAWGLQATQLLADQPLHDYYGPGSTLERFTQLEGQVVRLGADWNTMTLTHYAEFLAQVPNKRRVTMRYERADGRVQHVESLDDTDGIAEFDGEDYFENLLQAYFDEGHGARGALGTCPVEVLKAKPYIEFSVRWMEAHLG